MPYSFWTGVVPTSIRMETYSTCEACIGVLGIQDICHSTSRDKGYNSFHFQGYGILCTLV